MDSAGNALFLRNFHLLEHEGSTVAGKPITIYVGDTSYRCRRDQPDMVAFLHLRHVSQGGGTVGDSAASVTTDKCLCFLLQDNIKLSGIGRQDSRPEKICSI